ncbi:unnamed protein product [Hydatigera taeniaeformis]|uniref:Uncharacterized protein n=1 Tax=Hydatigena taeniaeformis TaxID=6205 RepID=A0A0R3WSS9_HYDTA|nr:unnamed protein product [Hydatigera taeniaeformis]
MKECGLLNGAVAGSECMQATRGREGALPRVVREELVVGEMTSEVAQHGSGRGSQTSRMNDGGEGCADCDAVEGDDEWRKVRIVEVGLRIHVRVEVEASYGVTAKKSLIFQLVQQLKETICTAATAAAAAPPPPPPLPPLLRRTHFLTPPSHSIPLLSATVYPPTHSLHSILPPTLPPATTPHSITSTECQELEQLSSVLREIGVTHMQRDNKAQWWCVGWSGGGDKCDQLKTLGE